MKVHTALGSVGEGRAVCASYRDHRLIETERQTESERKRPMSTDFCTCVIQCVQLVLPYRSNKKKKTRERNCLGTTQSKRYLTRAQNVFKVPRNSDRRESYTVDTCPHVTKKKEKKRTQASGYGHPVGSCFTAAMHGTTPTHPPRAATNDRVLTRVNRPSLATSSTMRFQRTENEAPHRRNGRLAPSDMRSDRNQAARARVAAMRHL